MCRIAYYSNAGTACSETSVQIFIAKNKAKNKKQMIFHHLLYSAQEERSFPVNTGGSPV